MKKIYFRVLFATLFCMGALTVSAKDPVPLSGGLFDNFGAGIKGGILYGAGVDAATSLHPNLKLRAGYSFFTLDIGRFIEEGSDGNEQIKDAKADFSNANLLVDYFPAKNGVFFVTGGLFFGHNNVDVSGTGFDAFSLNNHVIVPDANGYFEATAKFGTSVKPYLGIGVGRTIPQRRVGFRFEAGMVYQGNFSVDSPQLDPDGDPSVQSEGIEMPVLESKFWPMLNMTITFRIK